MRPLHSVWLLGVETPGNWRGRLPLRLAGMKGFALVLRFLLEIAALVLVGLFAWIELPGVWAWIGAIGLPLVMIVIWGTFNVPGDPSRGGGAPVVVSGVVRLVIEVVFFGSAVAAATVVASLSAGLAFLCGVVISYALDEERLKWLLEQPSPRRG